MEIPARRRPRTAAIASLVLSLGLVPLPAAAKDIRAVLANPIGKDLQGIACKSRDPNKVGPFDYTLASDRAGVAVVEKRHFTPKVASLLDGESATIEADLAYTLNSVPNHYRALQAAIEYAVSGSETSQKRPLEMPPECWLQRALVFRPQDPNLRVLFGNYYVRIKRYELAVEQYQNAVKLAPRSPEAHYNLGLALFKLQRFEEARKHAKIAYSLNYPLPALRDQLKDSGFPL